MSQLQPPPQTPPQPSPAVQPVPDLNPSQATGVSLGVTPPRIGALESEKTRGREQVSFRLPGSLKAIVVRIVNDPRFGFDSNMSRLFLWAVGYALFLYEPYFRGDREVDEWARRVKELDTILGMQEPVEEFREHLKRAEEKAEAALLRRSLDYGFNLLRGAIAFASHPDDESLRGALAEMLRASRPLQALCTALVEDEGYGNSDAVDRMQKFMGGSL